jgi:hypothetical protein
MIVVHFAKVSTLYPRVVISSLAKQLEKPPFRHSYTSFGVWPRDHSSDQGTLSRFKHDKSSSKQVVPYRTCGGTYCPGLSTPMTQSLADLGMTNHITWRIPTVSTVANLAQTTALNLTTVTSHHNGWKTNALNIPWVELNIIKMDRLTRHSRLHG